MIKCDFCKKEVDDLYYESNTGMIACDECGEGLYEPLYLINNEFSLIFQRGDEEMWKEVWR